MSKPLTYGHFGYRESSQDSWNNYSYGYRMDNEIVMNGKDADKSVSGFFSVFRVFFPRLPSVFFFILIVALKFIMTAVFCKLKDFI